MDDASVRTALLVARTAESRGFLRPGDWPDVAVSLLLEGAEDPAIAELAGLNRQANGWDTEPRLLAGLAPPDFESDLAGRCFTAAEYLDCGCAEADLGFEAELQSMPTLGLSAPVTQALARPLRSTLPTTQPAYGHHEH
ncbi:hypothetical protein Amsp01_093940 [Amycolatopsis sp. NBRC 101858]|uniref:hypothetical protein n=1 Tax=Amycolatopsis sp. NBRC 101858 TaxID=3032200 RepID=UPI0024A15224|nr:hypothetical protein [Amycolatopsis sp. NBRC 101858]GLY43371.1 hypothetical protein Amsp01_093940 [Amycolatopsis sp. NBRC 101858]